MFFEDQISIEINNELVSNEKILKKKKKPSSLGDSANSLLDVEIIQVL